MRILIIIVSILFLYVEFATIFNSITEVGKFGELIGSKNIEYFGMFAYIDSLLFLVPMYFLYAEMDNLKKPSFYIGYLFAITSLFTLNLLVMEPVNLGMVGALATSTILPLIGEIGLWLTLLLTTLLSIVVLKGNDYSLTNALVNFYNHIKVSWGVVVQVLKNKIKELSERSENFETAPMGLPREKEKEPAFSIEEEEFKKVIEQQGALKQRELNIEEDVRELKNKGIEVVDELSENSKLMEDIEKGKVERPKNFKLPKIDFLQKGKKEGVKLTDYEIDRKVEELMSKLREFKIEGEVVRTYTGPIVTTFEFKPEANVKVSKIMNLQDDLAMALSAKTIRIQAPIPGRNVVGIEIPNKEFDTIYLREILESDIFKSAKSPLTVALGKDIVGKPFITDIKRLPHLLIAGTTGSGKSVGINAMILSLLYRNDPDNLKLMLIDPKMLEFTMYNDIPHLLTPVITNPEKAIAALTNMVAEMERRYTLMAESRTKNIDNYNEKARKENVEEFPFIVVVIDELADLMMTAGKEVEVSIARLAQKSRACGIHLIVATQRPSVDVVTGLIKANLPSRLSYRVGQRIDSKVILDTQGAESLLGNGDGLFTPPGSTGLVRIHAPWNSETEIDKIVDFIKKQREPEYDEGYLIPGYVEKASVDKGDIKLDDLYEDAREVVLTDNKTSISYLQRKLSIGYNRAANIIEQLEQKGVLSSPNAKGNRKIL